MAIGAGPGPGSGIGSTRSPGGCPLGSAATMFHLGSFWEPDSPADWITLALVLLAVESNVPVLAASAATPPPLDEDE